MDDLSGLMSGLGGEGAGDASGAADPASALSGLVSAEGGLDGLVAKLRDAGLGEQVDSWIGTGPNQPIDANQLSSALGEGEIQRLSSGSGLDIMSLLPMLAAFLPQLVNMLTPNGTVPDAGLDAGLGSGGMGDLGGLLGGLMGGSAGGTGGAAGLDDLLGGLGGLMGGDSGR